MKKLLLFAFAAVLCCGLTACSSDDDGGSGNYEELIVGSWKIVKEYEGGEWDIYDPDEIEDIYFFGPNGTGYNEGWETFDGNLYDWEDEFTYELSGNRLTISYESYSETDSWVIEKLTDTELVVQEEEDGDVEEKIYFTRTF